MSSYHVEPLYGGIFTREPKPLLRAPIFPTLGRYGLNSQPNFLTGNKFWMLILVAALGTFLGNELSK